MQDARPRRSTAAPRDGDAPDATASRRTPGSAGAAFARRSVGEGVADHIRQLVFSGALRDGDRVPQRQIAEELGVSSVPVREAIVGLQREGVVTIEPNRGAFVNGLDPEVVTEQFYVYGRVYGFAIRRATERATPAWIDEIDALAKRIRSERDVDKKLAASIRLQQQIIELGGSKRLLALLRPLWHIVPGNFFVAIPGSFERSQRGIAAILAGIRAGEPEAAEAAAWSMMEDLGELLAEQLRDRQRS